MTFRYSRFAALFLVASACGALVPTSKAESPAAALAAIKTAADLEAVVTASDNAAFKQLVQKHQAAILAAAAQRPHVAAVVRAIELSPGRFEKVNTTPADLEKEVGKELDLFNTLILVDLAIANAGPHDHRQVDPYDAAFFEHLGQITTLESLNIIATKLNDEWLASLRNLKNLKLLKFTNNGKLSDAGLQQLAGLSQVENFSFVGTGMKGHAFAHFEGWTKLTRSSFRGSSLDDKGLQLLCERFPNYENLSLAHAKFTDAGAVHLAKLTKLKGLEIGSRNATPACLTHVAQLPLEYLQIGDGLDAAAGIAFIKNIPTLRRLTLTNVAALSDAELKSVASIRQLEQLELGKLALSDERLTILKEFAVLKSMRLVPAAGPFSAEVQAQVKLALPKVELKLQ